MIVSIEKKEISTQSYTQVDWRATVRKLGAVMCLILVYCSYNVQFYKSDVQCTTYIAATADNYIGMLVYILAWLCQVCFFQGIFFRGKTEKLHIASLFLTRNYEIHNISLQFNLSVFKHVHNVLSL